jgi:hypothetical protein
MLSDVFNEVCDSLKVASSVEPTDQIRDAIGTAIFNQAKKGVRDPKRLKDSVLRKVEAYNGVQRTLSRFAHKAS